MEKWDVYDLNRNKLKNKVAVRDVKDLGENEYHLVTVSWIYNSNREVLMQKRASHKMYPLVYANHGGCALLGETSEESMLRELREEIGITLTLSDLIYLRTFHDDDTIFDEYIVHMDIELRNLVIDEREVESCSWFSMDELSQLIDEGRAFNYKTNNPNGVSSFQIISKYLKEKK